MRGKARRASLGTFVLIAVLAGCGGDDDQTPQDSGSDSRDTRGGGGAAGGDAARADTSVDGAGSDGRDGSAGTSGSGGTGGSSGSGGTGGSSGTGGTGATGGTSDAALDRAGDGQSGADSPPDGGSIVDVSADADGTGIADSTVDRVDSDGNAVSDGPDETGSDAPIDAPQGGDAGSSDAPDGGDAPASDASDAGDGASLDAFDAAACNDGNAATIDFYNPLYGCGHKFDANPGDGDAWITYDAGFHVDVATGLGWVFPAGSRSASAAATECDAFSVAGLTNWRLATIDEARSLADGCAPTKTGGSCPLDDPSCLTSSCGFASPACDSCSAAGGPHAGQYCKVDAICSFFHTSSACSDCTDASATDWIYIPINGNFYPMPSGSGIPTACVSVVPNGVPPSDGG